MLNNREPGSLCKGRSFYLHFFFWCTGFYPSGFQIITMKINCRSARELSVKGVTEIWNQAG